MGKPRNPSRLPHKKIPRLVYQAEDFIVRHVSFRNAIVSKLFSLYHHGRVIVKREA